MIVMGRQIPFITTDPRQLLKTLLHQTRQNAQTWTDLLSASGGTLELAHCSCLILQWQFSIQGAPALTPLFPNENTQVRVRDTYTKHSQPIQILSAYQAHKTLGHY
jgi:hypothetical protein